MAPVWAINSMASQEVFNELTLAMQCSAVINHFRYEDLAPEGVWRHHLTLQPPVTARKDDAPAAVQAAIVNVAVLDSISAGGGLIQTTSD